MSKHNYSQYSKKNNNHPAAETDVTPVTEEVIEPVIDVAVEPVVQPVVTEPEVVQEPTPKTVEGTVVGCAKLNVRVKPNIYAAVVNVIDANDKVVIDTDESVKDWYKVRTTNGIIGFCMRKYVNANL